MKRFKKAVVFVLVLALALPVLFGSTANASAKQKKVTVKSIMKQMDEASAEIKSMDAKMKFNLDLGELGSAAMDMDMSMVMDPMAMKMDMNLDMSKMAALLKAAGTEVSADELKQNVQMYMDTVDGNIYIYMSMDKGATWMKIKAVDASTMEKMMSMADGSTFTTDIPAFKLAKETKKAYTMKGSVEFTEDMLDAAFSSASSVSDAIDEGSLDMVKDMFKGAKGIDVKFVVDKETMLPKSINVNMTAFINSLMKNLSKTSDELALMSAFEVKDCSMKMSFSNYNKATVTVPEAAKAAPETDVTSYAAITVAA